MENSDTMLSYVISNNQLLSAILYLLIFFFIYIVMRLIYRIFNWLIP